MAAGSERWDHEDIFNRDSIRRFAVAMTTNKDSLGSFREKAYHFRKFGSENITWYWYGSPKAGTPSQTDDDKKIHLPSVDALTSEQHGQAFLLTIFSITTFWFSMWQVTSKPLMATFFVNSPTALFLLVCVFQSAHGQYKAILLGENISTIRNDSSQKLSKNILQRNQIESRKWLVNWNCGNRSKKVSI